MVWVWPVSALVVVGVMIVYAESLLMIFTNPAKWGVSIARFAGFALVSLMTLAVFLYACIGFYQAFFIELRQKFIARKVIYWDGDGYQLWGYYFKRDTFKPSEVISVDEHHVKIGFGLNIFTLLTWQTHNYKITLKDGREFYLPGEMERVEELRMQFEADIQTALNA